MSHNCKCSEEEVFDFGEAIRRAKAGRKLTRFRWDTEDQWIGIMPSLYVAGGEVTEGTHRFIENRPEFRNDPYFVMFAESRQWEANWRPKQEDMIAEDWMEFTETKTTIIQ